MLGGPPTMTIGGVPAFNGAHIPVYNPATQEIVAQISNAGAPELNAAVAAARDAFHRWSALAWSDRQALIVRIGDTIVRHTAELSAMLTREQGKPAEQADFEIMSAAHWCHATASLQLPPRVIEEGPERRQFTRYCPLGVVAAISPWNFPFLLSIWKIAPALLTGNTVVLKPSPFTPMTVLRLGELVRGFRPPGVLNIICGDDNLGPMMTSHPDVDKVTFTGSTATGRRVMASAAPTLKRLTLELGGNDAAIVLPDVDVEATALKLFWSAFTNSGQVCIATKRAYVHEAIYDRILAAMAKLVREMRMGDGSREGVVLGPVQNRPQFERVMDLIRDCEQHGYPMIQGTVPEDGAGYFAPATLVDNPPATSRIVREEQFGPILPLLRYSDIDDAVRQVNDSEMGLAATIWTRDIDKGLQLAERLQTGSVWINEALAPSPLAAFGGRKQSGLGSENGIEGLLAFCEPKTFVVAH